MRDLSRLSSTYSVRLARARILAAVKKQQGRLQFEYVADEADDNVTALGGLPLVAEIMSAFGVDETIRKSVRLGRAARRFEADDIARAVVLTMIAGGDCLDDIGRLRDDDALCRLLGRDLPSPETVRQALYEFHSDYLVEEGERLAADDGRRAAITPESPQLRGLAAALRELNARIQARWPMPEATLDIDATIQNSSKREAKWHYEGSRGYQPIVAYWAEQQVVVFDEFRDGNVSANTDAAQVIERAFASLPSTVHVRRFRGDSAMYSEESIRWLHANRIEYAVGAKASRAVRDECEERISSEWLYCDTRESSKVDVIDLRHRPNWTAGIEGLRYIGIRITPRQDDLWNPDEVTYLVIATNRPGPAADVLKWYWEKAGTIEHVHDVVKNDLGAGVLPCGRFGANAAWFRLATLAFNILRVIREIGPPDLRNARPKRLRLNLFAIPARVVSHARTLIARVGRRLRRAEELLAARELIWTT